MTSRPETAAAPHPGPPSVHLATAIATVRAWLASDTPTLAITGPAGMGKSSLAAQLPAGLTDIADTTSIWPRTVGSRDDARHLCHAVAAELSRGTRSGETTPELLLVLDDLDAAEPAARELVLELPRQHPSVRLLVTCAGTTMLAELDGAMELPLGVLAGSLDTSIADWDDFLGQQVVQVFLACLRRRNPAFEPDPAAHAALARICAAGFGIPGELDLLADLVDRCGMESICAAVGEVTSRHHLAELVDDLGHSHLDLGPDELVVLSSVFAAPGGASIDMLRRTLPRCDIDAALRSLTDRGLLHGTVDQYDQTRRTQPNRFHLRVSAAPLASWCSCQSEVSFAAIRHAHADYLQASMQKLTEQLFGDAQQLAFAEFRQELPNLRATIVELIGMAQFAPVVALMHDSLPLLARSCGIAEILPDVLRVVRAYEPTDPAETRRLGMLTVRVLAAAGEQEAAAIHLDELVDSDEGLPAGPDIALLRVVATDEPDVDAVEDLAETVETCRRTHDLRHLAELTGEYFALLMRRRQFERADHDSRTVLCEATRGGDAYAGGIALLWRAVSSCVSASGTGETRRLVERALRKLRPMGAAATYSAIRVVLDNRHLDHLGHGGIDLAMITGALSHNDFAAGNPVVTGPPALPEAEERLSERIGTRAVIRWAAAGAAADLTDMLSEMLKRRYVDELPGSVELPRSGVEQSAQIDPTSLGVHSSLTNREAEVASLVATGLTNKQVAFRLHISEWTVINHLRQVMRKLDCTSRVQVARWVTTTTAASA